MRNVNAKALVVAVVLPMLLIGLIAIAASRAENTPTAGPTPGSTAIHAGNSFSEPITTFPDLITPDARRGWDRQLAGETSKTAQPSGVFELLAM